MVIRYRDSTLYSLDFLSVLPRKPWNSLRISLIADYTKTLEMSEKTQNYQRNSCSKLPRRSKNPQRKGRTGQFTTAIVIWMLISWEKAQQIGTDSKILWRHSKHYDFSAMAFLASLGVHVGNPRDPSVLKTLWRLKPSCFTTAVVFYYRCQFAAPCFP